jgi:type IV pilus assembly protein PilE
MNFSYLKLLFIRDNIMKINSQKGFSLLELMVAVAIVAILSTVAMSYYGDSVDSARCTDGRSAVVKGSSSLEKCKAVYGVYNDPNCATASFLGDTTDGYFNVTMTSDATTFTLTATAKGSAASNDICSTITLNHLGVEGGTGSSPW